MDEHEAKPALDQNQDFAEVIEELRQKHEKTYDGGPNKITPEDETEVFALMARYLFGGASNTAIAAALGKSKRTVQRVRGKDQFKVYYKEYIERQMGDVDVRLRGRVREYAPRILERLWELAMQDKHRQVAYHACKDLLDRYGLQPDITRHKAEIQIPEGTLQALRQIGQRLAAGAAGAPKDLGSGALPLSIGDGAGATLEREAGEVGGEEGAGEDPGTPA